MEISENPQTKKRIIVIRKEDRAPSTQPPQPATPSTQPRPHPKSRGPPPQSQPDPNAPPAPTKTAKKLVVIRKEDRGSNPPQTPQSTPNQAQTQSAIPQSIPNGTKLNLEVSGFPPGTALPQIQDLLNTYNLKPLKLKLLKSDSGVSAKVNLPSLEACHQAKKQLEGLSYGGRSQLRVAFLHKNFVERKLREKHNKERAQKQKKNEHIPREIQGVQERLKNCVCQQHSELQVVVQMKPTDPEFPFSLECVRLLVGFAESFPQEGLSFRVLNKDIPQVLRAKIEKALRERAESAYKGKVGVLVPLLRFLDNKLAELMVDDTLTQKYHERRILNEGYVVITPSQLKSAFMQQGGGDEEREGGKEEAQELVINERKDQSEEKEGELRPHLQIELVQKAQFNFLEDRGTDDNSEGEQNSAEDQGDEEEGEEGGTPNAGSKRAGEKDEVVKINQNAMKIRLNEVQRENVVLAELKQPVFLLKCNKCRTTAECAITSPEPATHTCEKCRQIIGVQYKPVPLHFAHASTALTSELVQDEKGVIGSVDTMNCSLYELLPSTFVLWCEECVAPVSVCALSPLTRKSEKCTKCFKPVALHIESYEFLEVRATQGNRFLASSVEKKKSQQQKKPREKPQQFVLNTPLPNNGACSHYKKSNRWFKFPCCGRCFPCDVCHDKETDHEHQLASVQICGFCSKSFPVSKKECPNCDSSTIKKKSSFWEGGSGCRNTTYMNQNDRKKYSGTNKTISNKAKKRLENN